MRCSIHLGGLRSANIPPVVSPVSICHKTQPKPYTSTAAVPATELNLLYKQWPAKAYDARMLPEQGNPICTM